MISYMVTIATTVTFPVLMTALPHVFDLDELTPLAVHLHPLLALAVEAAGQLVVVGGGEELLACLLYTSPSPRDSGISRMPSSA